MRASNLKQLFAMVTKYSLILVAAIAILGGAAGFFLSGTNGLISALIGAAIAFVFSILTILSVFVGSKMDIAGFYAIVLGGWLLKIVIFGIVLVALRGAEFIDGPLLFTTVVVTVIGTLAVDSYAALRARIPAVE